MGCLQNLYLLFLLVVMVPLAAMQQPNTDAFSVFSFFQKMGVSARNPVCSWTDVVFCDGNNVMKLLASGFGVSGVIPEATVGKLYKLQELDLSNNSISAFSSDFYELGASLRKLNLSGNQISGSLSNNFGNFASLQVLDLSDNNLSGEIPAALGALTGLQALVLKGNAFQGQIPAAVGSLTSLVTLDLSENRFTGSLPDGFVSELRNLRSLNLAENGISGKSSDFTGMNSVEYLNISGNLFQGSVFGIFRNSLRVIDASRNRFQGLIPQVTNDPNFTWSNLEVLDLSENAFSGEFSGDLSSARLLKRLNLAYNRFQPQKFPPLFELTNLQVLNLSRTKIIGSLPAEISGMRSLSVLDLSVNMIIGRIPVELASLKLKQLDLSQNNLTGEVPKPLLNDLSKMERFNLSYNNLTICSSMALLDKYPSSFVGTKSVCPIAVEPTRPFRKGRKPMQVKLTIAIVLATVFFVVGFLCLLFACRRRNNLWVVKQVPVTEDRNVSGPFSFEIDSRTWVADVKLAKSVPVIMFEKPLLNFTFADLLTATSNFDQGTLLAEGRYGPVYRGVLPGGMHVAVKVLVNSASVSDDEAAKELERIGRIKHANLVPLVGYCLAGDQRIAIYEFMENGNLQNWLHDLPFGGQVPDDWSADTWEEDNETKRDGFDTWEFRHRIALGTARALAFLHHGCFPQIIHKDVKASSIYLDSSLEPRLSDFGLAMIASTDPRGETTTCASSPGYSPPEFSEPGDSVATNKSDVYAFGVVLFELLTGKKPVDDEYPSNERESSLVKWVRDLVKKNSMSKAIYPKIFEAGLKNQIEEALRIGYLCTADSPSKRPTMQQVVGLLKDIEPVGG